MRGVYPPCVACGTTPHMLLLLSLALAAEPLPVELKPIGYVRPSGSWIQDDPSSTADQDGFSVNARIGLYAKYGSCGVDANVEAELTPEFALKDGWVRGKPVCWLGLQVGQFKVPFSISQLASDTRRQLPLNPRIVTAAGITRDIGVALEWKLPIQKKIRFTGTAGMFNGEGSNRIQNGNQDFLYALRGVITPFGARDAVFEGSDQSLYLGVGGGWVYNLSGADESAEERNAFGADLQFAYRWFSVQAEYIDVDVFHASTDVADFHIRGGYGQLGMFIPGTWTEDHLEVVGRYEVGDPNTAFADPGLSGSGATAIPTFQAASVATVGLNIYFMHSDSKTTLFHDVKLQMAYSHPNETEGAAVLDDNFVATGTVRF